MKDKETMENADGPIGQVGDEAIDQDGGAHEHEEVMLADDSSGEQVAADELTREDGLLRDLEDLQDRHLRLAAEFENYRKRTRRELSEMRRRSQADLVRSLLDVLDDLSRVAHAAPDATVPSLVEGVSLVEAKMRKVLGEAGLTRIDAAGQPFDPNLHEALAARPTTDPKKDDLVSNVMLDGYTFGEILVRPARVEVAKYEPPATFAQDEAVEGDDA